MIHILMMEKILAFIKAWRGPLLSGLLIGTSYVPFPPWAALFCYAPLFLWLTADHRTGRQAFFAGWLSQFILSLIGFHWIAHTAHAFGSFPWPLAILVLLLFAAFIHLHLPIAAWIFQQLRRRTSLEGAPALFALALIFALVERVWPMIFPWHMGYTLLWAKIPIYQWADVIGFSGLSTLLFLANAWVAWIWRRRSESKLVIRHASALAATLIGLSLGGMLKEQAWKEGDETLNVLAVQANIGNMEKMYAERGRGYQAAITSKFVDLTKEGLQLNTAAELVIWPETAFPDYGDRPDRARPRLDLIAQGLGPLGRPILTGAYAKDPDPTSNLSYNALFLLGPSGELLAGPYRKTLLLIFGEYLPLSETFPILLDWLPFISNFGRGPGPSVLGLRRPDGSELKIGGQICYEGLFPDFTRGLAEKDAQILANVTNDSWFGTPFEPRQHMIMTMARAIEVRRPLVRSTNTGITSAILADGRRLQESPSNKEWTGLFRIDYKRHPRTTFYVLGGHFDWVLWLLGLIGIVLINRRPARPARD